MRPFFLIAYLSAFLIPASALFEEFKIVEPGSGELELYPRFEVHSEDKQTVRVTLPQLPPDMGVWLIIAKAPLPDDQLDFRSFVWGAPLPSHIQFLGPLAHKVERSAFGSPDPAVPLLLRRDQMSRAYLSIDYPEPVDDGGFHYTVKLGAFDPDLPTEPDNAR